MYTNNMHVCVQSTSCLQNENATCKQVISLCSFLTTAMLDGYHVCTYVCGGDGVCVVWRLLVVVMVYVWYGGC